MKLFWLACLAGAVVAQGDNPAKGLIQARKGYRYLFDLDSTKSSSLDRIPLEESTLIRFVLDFAARSRWESVVFFFSNSSDFARRLSPVLFNYLNGDGKLVAVHSTSSPLLPESILHHRHKLGIVYLCDVLDEDFLEKASDLDFFDAYRSWLIIKPAKSSEKLEEVLRGLNLGLATELVVATLERRTIPTSATSPAATATTPTDHLIGYRKRHAEDERCPDRYKRDLAGDPNLVVHLVQVYKASPAENETLPIKLGFWDVPNGMLKTRDPINPEERWNLGGYKVSVGVKNSTRLKGAADVVLDRFSYESETDEESRFLELFDCLMVGINASFEVVQFQKLGWRNEEGGWTHLLGAVVDGTVDFALETINPNVDKTQDMFFTYAIVITMNNIYFRRPKSGGFRDIFMAPFSPRLLLCVLTTSFLLAVAMISITVVNYHMVEAKKGNPEFQILTRRKKERSVVVTAKENRKWEISEAALWSVSILCMQGSQWSPKSISGSLLLINSLLFALIIYNSFAAFITSVLSVKDVKIKDLKDLTGSDFAFGYTLGDSDELFLRTVNDTLLRELYFKGLRENDGVANPIAGMKRASKGKYAFFVGARMARRALRTIIAHDTRCQFQELHLHVTRTFASLPVTRKSSLKKILNYKIIKLMETGILDRFRRLLLPPMPRCVEKTAFNSAKLTDVYSAFFVLAVGWFASVVILLSEIVWYKRKKREKHDARGKFKYNGFPHGEDLYWLR